MPHVVGAYSEDIERFQQVDVVWAIHIYDTAAPFEAEPKPFEPHATTEELDNLRAFRPSDVHQPHRADAPAIPAFGELLGADQDVDGRIPVVDPAKER